MSTSSYFQNYDWENGLDQKDDQAASSTSMKGSKMNQNQPESKKRPSCTKDQLNSQKRAVQRAQQQDQEEEEDKEQQEDFSSMRKNKFVRASVQKDRLKSGNRKTETIKLLQRDASAKVSSPIKKKFEQQQKLLSKREMATILTLVFTNLDPKGDGMKYLQKKGITSNQKVDAVMGVIKYLLQYCRSHDKRQEQLFMNRMGKETLEEIERAEYAAEQNGEDILAVSDEDGELVSDDEDDVYEERDRLEDEAEEEQATKSDEDFLAPEGPVLLTLEAPKKPKKKIFIPEEEYANDICQEESISFKGTNIDELD